MAASYPASVKTFSTKAAGGAVASAHINDLQNEVVAVETQLGVNAGTWVTWTPTVTFVGVTSTTVDYARYSRIGKVISFYAKISVVKGNSTASTCLITLPVNSLGTTLANGANSIMNGTTIGWMYTSTSAANESIYCAFVSAIQNDGSIYISGTYEAE